MAIAFSRRLVKTRPTLADEVLWYCTSREDCSPFQEVAEAVWACWGLLGLELWVEFG